MNSKIMTCARNKYLGMVIVYEVKLRGETKQSTSRMWMTD
jgi:hypothetical protein